jgi:histidinol-phosphate/aromatic aminotransferase/cobyric acid decarboxylase-like protein
MKLEMAGGANRPESAAEVRRHLFYETSHSPALTDLVGYQKAKEIVDFCFIANPYYPTPGMLEDLQRNLPNLIKSYPSSNPLMSQKHLAAVLGVDQEHLIIGNGATELISLIDVALIDRVAIPIPTFGEYVEKICGMLSCTRLILETAINCISITI